MIHELTVNVNGDLRRMKAIYEGLPDQEKVVKMDLVFLLIFMPFRVDREERRGMGRFARHDLPAVSAWRYTTGKTNIPDHVALASDCNRG